MCTVEVMSAACCAAILSAMGCAIALFSWETKATADGGRCSCVVHVCRWDESQNIGYDFHLSFTALDCAQVGGGHIARADELPACLRCCSSHTRTPYTPHTTHHTHAIHTERVA